MQEQRCSKCGQVMLHVPEFSTASRQAMSPPTHAQCPPGPTIELHKNGAAATGGPTAVPPNPQAQAVVKVYRWDLNERPSLVHYVGLNLVCLLLFIALLIGSYALDSVALPAWLRKVFGWAPPSFSTLFFSLSPLPLVYAMGCNFELRSRTYKLAADGRYLLILSGIFFRRIAQVDLLHAVNITTDRPLLYRLFTKAEADICDVLLFLRPPNGPEEVVVIPAMRNGSLLKERFTQHIITLRRLFSRHR